MTKLTIGELAAYAGVTVRAVRHYHQIGLLPEPERDASGYRRYGATAVVDLIKIRSLAEAGVPLSQIGSLLAAGPAAFAEAIHRIDQGISEEIQRLEHSRKQIAQLLTGDTAALPASVTAYLDRLREIGVSERMVQAERDGWILVAAHWPDRVDDWMPSKFALLEDPRLVRLYLILSAALDADTVDSALLGEAADIMVAFAEEAEAAGQAMTPEELQDSVPFELLDSLVLESDPRAGRMLDLMHERGWTGWIRAERLP
ncbi:MerR family transcriptional regulator [Actinoplanes sp. NPDC051411]|uniref:MerR family transcriptional regulator n=1 Tax=Actinoplanes sp. NPDC051411 TaxID=3155522 RepID=UPI003438ADB0